MRLVGMVHLSKLSVGIRDLSHLRAMQASRLKVDGVLLHRTRLGPKRVAELTAGGSIYWIIAGAMLARQHVLAVEPTVREDGRAAVALILDALLVPVTPRAVRPFQGWRYLEAPDAPADLLDSPFDLDAMPDALQRELRALALL